MGVLKENKLLIALCFTITVGVLALFSYAYALWTEPPPVSIKLRELEPPKSEEDIWKKTIFDDEYATLPSSKPLVYGPNPPLPKSRRVRRFGWNSVGSREEVWNIPREESRESTATAFLRVCMSEASGNKSDCLGIWQVIRNIRSKNCDRDSVRNITECDEHGETYLSAMRRASHSLLGMTQPKSRRQRWISQLNLDCNPPRTWPRAKHYWENNYRDICEETVELSFSLVDGRRNHAWPIRGARVIAWGGRCESGDGACDDDIACGRGLARVKTKTLNAFWCRPGTRGCSDDIDPICIKRGFRSIRKTAEVDSNMNS